MQQLARSMLVEGEPLLRQRVVGTAAVYFRKFYLGRGDFGAADPRLMAPACLFLAAKTGGWHWAGGLGGLGGCAGDDMTARVVQRCCPQAAKACC